MRMVYIILGVLVLAFVIFQVKIYMSTDSTEQRPYEVIKSDGIFEIRHYSPAVVAAYTNPTSGQSGSFGVLAGYIFGGNQEGQSIAMTSPVEMEPRSGGEEMRFTMPAKWQMQDLPKPKDDRVRLEKTDGYYAATVQFGGFATEAKRNSHKKKLTEWMNAQGLTPKGDWVQLGYNPPYQLVGRRNEMMMRLEGFEEK